MFSPARRGPTTDTERNGATGFVTGSCTRRTENPGVRSRDTLITDNQELRTWPLPARCRRSQVRNSCYLYPDCFVVANEELGRRGLPAHRGELCPALRGDSLDFVAATAALSQATAHDALDQLITLNLVQSSGDLHRRRYLIHSLTRTFLLEQAARWQ